MVSSQITRPLCEESSVCVHYAPRRALSQHHAPSHPIRTPSVTCTTEKGPQIPIRTRGSYAIAESLGKVVGNPLVGYFKQRTGGYTADSLIFASMSGAAVILCLLISIVDKWRGGTLNDRGNLHKRRHGTGPE